MTPGDGGVVAINADDCVVARDNEASRGEAAAPVTVMRPVMVPQVQPVTAQPLHQW